MSEEFRNNQDENLEENGSVYHYNYINSESSNFGKSPKHDKDLRKMMKRAAAIALAVALVGGSFGAGSYVSTHYGAVAQASETESESETAPASRFSSASCTNGSPAARTSAQTRNGLPNSQTSAASAATASA